jgi:hypothetical protein
MNTLIKEQVTDTKKVTATCKTCKKRIKKLHLLICFKCHKPIHFSICGKWLPSIDIEDEVYFCCLECN